MEVGGPRGVGNKPLFVLRIEFSGSLASFPADSSIYTLSAEGFWCSWGFELKNAGAGKGREKVGVVSVKLFWG